jgi:hypothetical protein
MVNKRNRSESAQETLRYLAGRPFGVTVKELGKARNGKTVGPYQRTIEKGLKDEVIYMTQTTRQGYVVAKLFVESIILADVKRPKSDRERIKKLKKPKKQSTERRYVREGAGVREARLLNEKTDLDRAERARSIKCLAIKKKSKDKKVAGILRLLADLLEE